MIFEDTQDLAETAAQLSDYEERPVRREGERRTERSPSVGKYGRQKAFGGKREQNRRNQKG